VCPTHVWEPDTWWDIEKFAVWMMGCHPTETSFNVAIHGLDYITIAMHFIIGTNKALLVKPMFLQNTEFNNYNHCSVTSWSICSTTTLDPSTAFIILNRGATCTTLVL